MIRRIIDLLQEGMREVRRYPQLQIAFVLVLLLPAAFVYVGYAFLDAGRYNQDSLQQQSIHTIHQSLHLLLSVHEFNLNEIQRSLQQIQTENTDWYGSRVLLRQGDLLVVIASTDRQELDATVAMDSLYTEAVRLAGQTVHQLVEHSGRTMWRSVQVGDPSSRTLFVTESFYDLTNSQQIFLTGAIQAYVVLMVVFLTLIMISYWHIRSTSYQDLYEYIRAVLKNRQRFTHMVTHELRAPLTAIRGYASMLQESNTLSPEQQKQVQNIQRSSERVLSIVGELLEIAQIQSGKIKVEVASVDLAELVTLTLDELRPLTRNKQISLSQSGVLHRATVTTDPKRVQQILVNLVSNAIKYSEEGRIEVEIKQLHTGYELRIKDTGLGISAENQRKLFAPFFRIQDQKRYDALGVGLGMWITRQYIDVIGASVEVESIKDVGTHVVITIPKEFAVNNL